jgi:hypothetical protein
MKKTYKGEVHITDGDKTAVLVPATSIAAGSSLV